MGVDPAEVENDAWRRPPLSDDLGGLIGLWGTMHGLVMLEINNHLPFLDEHEPVFVDAMERALSGWRA
jgi:hypothetical protein